MNPDRDELLRMSLVRRIAHLPAPQLARLAAALDEITADASRAATDADDWIEVRAAATEMAVSAGHLTRLCRDKFSLDGRAKLVKPELGKPTWWVRRTLDPRLNVAQGARKE